MSQAKFTPAPWTVDTARGVYFIETMTEDCIAALDRNCGTIEQRIANARRIVLCVNLFDELVGAVGRELAELDFADAPTDAQRARRKYLFALLQRARGE